MQPTALTVALALFAGSALAGRDHSRAFLQHIAAQPPHPQITVPVESIALPIQSVVVPVENIIVPSVLNPPAVFPAPPPAPSPAPIPGA
ncbi:hypothetical protein yc1106_00329 [Curvularia clavata]|uniref:Uncharacterized protein n=1 Tax=Curvularia clavata TaxID=95742 RepID=A0A9Q8Z0X9_CURCL|nr:hypothetical protein yc1106_00329 [Curvularia clavata]